MLLFTHRFGGEVEGKAEAVLKRLGFCDAVHLIDDVIVFGKPFALLWRKVLFKPLAVAHHELHQLLMVVHEKEKYGWEFIFLGADIDAIETAGRIGIDRSRAANYRKDTVDNETMFCSVNEAITMARACAPIDDSWKADVERNFEERK